MDARFLTACTNPKHFPETEMLEVAVAGRSNCGKSSLINALVGRKKLARTSSTPGRTREIVFFEVKLPRTERFLLVDLPGYGYAKVGKRQKESWAPLIGQYIEGRQQLEAMILLHDIRREPSQQERDLLQWCTERELAVLFVLTKADKLSKSRRFSAAAAAAKQLQFSGPPLTVSVRDEGSIIKLRQSLVALSRQRQEAAAAPLVVGLTGGIGAGKSIVAQMFGDEGAAVIDADQLARDVVAVGSPVLDQLVSAFGASILDSDNALDRARLGELVFNDAAARARLESITHPAIQKAADARISELAAAGQRLIVYEAALLIETGRHETMKPIIVVAADDELRLERIIQRDQLSRHDAEQRLAAQMPQRDKEQYGDYVIDNSGEIEQTRRQVRQLHAQLAGELAKRVSSVRI